MATRFSTPANRHFSDIGVPLSGGKLYFYEVNSTTTLQNTYADNDLSTANANPVILDQGGLEPNIFLDGSYRVVLTDSNDIQVWERDFVNAGTEALTAFDDWMSTVSYGSGGNNIVTGSDGKYYRSIQDPNLSNDPTSSPTFWEEIKFVQFWNTNVSYQIDDIVQASNGSQYVALVAQSGNDPIGDLTNWKPIAELNSGETTRFQSYRQIADASLGTGTHTFDYNEGDMQQLTATGDITIAFDNFVSGEVCAFVIDAVDWGAHTITLPAGMLFEGGINPAFTTSGTDRLHILHDKDDVLTLSVWLVDIST